MSHTRPIEDPIEIDPYRPPAPLMVEGTGHSVKSEIYNDHSVNEHLPYIWFNGIMSAFGLMCGMPNSTIVASFCILFHRRIAIAWSIA